MIIIYIYIYAYFIALICDIEQLHKTSPDVFLLLYYLRHRTRMHKTFTMTIGHVELCVGYD